MEVIRAADLSSAWLAAARLLVAVGPPYRLPDLVVDIADPRVEIPAIRAAVDGLTKGWSVESTANTIFPRSYVTDQSPEQLAARYASIRSRLRHTPANRLGTYLGQLLAYPPPTADAAPVNQLAIAVKNARSANRPENVYDMSIQVPGYNTRPRGFPCLAYLNFKIDRDRLLLTAHYRNHWFVERAYGNYVGLARLQSYLARQMDLVPGSLLCISGHAFIGGKIGEVRTLLARFDP